MKDEDIQDISFKESFRRARQLGLKTFPFKGKRYSTDLASSEVKNPVAKIEASKPAASEAQTIGNANEVPSIPRYKQDTYETPLKSAVRKYLPDVEDNLGKIVAGLGIAGAATRVGKGVVNSLKSMRNAKEEAALVKGNADLADRMKGITSAAEKEAAKNAAKRDMFNASEARMKSEAGKSAEERLTGLTMNPRRKNIPVEPSVRSRTKFKEDEEGVDFRKGGRAKAYAKGGSVSSASKRADGCATKGKTRCKVY